MNEMADWRKHTFKPDATGTACRICGGWPNDPSHTPAADAALPEHRCGVRGFAESGDECPACAYFKRLRDEPPAADAAAWKRFNETTGCLTGGASHPDRCVCQGKDDTPHKHYPEPPHSCARCSRCSAYTRAIPPAADAAPLRTLREENQKLWKLLSRMLKMMKYSAETHMFSVSEIAWLSQPYMDKNPSEWLRKELATIALKETS